jgi:hypothetical protein
VLSFGSESSVLPCFVDLYFGLIILIKERRLKVFENKVVRRMFRADMEQQGIRKLRNDILFTRYC